MSTKWREVAPTAGPRSRAAVAVIGVLGCAWLGWPVWSSFTAPDRDAVRHLTPYLLAALTGLLVLLAWALWRDAGRRTAVLAPILLIATADAGVRIFLSPGASGIEPVFALPLLAGVALGGPAGFLTGSLACLGSSVPLGLVAEPLVGQSLAWGLWGAAGGWLRPLRRAVAWPVAVALCFPLALATGFVLNAVGWAGETTVDAGGFLPGAGPWESLRRLVDYTAATSAALDLVRAVTNAAVVALIGMPVLGALRAAVGARPGRAVVVAPAPRVTEAALARRRRSDRLDHLWTPTEGEPE